MNPTNFCMVENQWYIIKACMIDLALDNCAQFSNRATNGYKYLENFSSLSLKNHLSFTEIEKQLRDIIDEKEPYCGSFDECLSDSFVEDRCRPQSSCTYTNGGVCMYVNSLSDSIMGEYREYLDEKVNVASSKGGASSSDDNVDGKDDKRRSKAHFAM